MIVATVVDHDDNNRISIVGEGNVIQLKASEIPRSSRIGRDNDKIADRGGISDPHITTHIPPSIIQVLLARGMISACFLTRNRPDFTPLCY